MKNMYRYFLVGKKFIVRTYSRKVSSDTLRRYLEVNKELFDRAEKYGYIKVALD